MNGKDEEADPSKVSWGRRGWLARRTAWAISRISPRGASAEVDAELLIRHVDVTFRANAPEADEWGEIESGFAHLANQGLWLSTLERLRGVDQSRQQFVSGKRYFDCALAGALAPVTRHLGGEPDLPGAIAALPIFEAVVKEHPRDYMSAVLLSGALCEIGWALRGSAARAALGEDADTRHREYFARAEAALEAFDPIEENSPMLAEARYFLTPGIDGGREVLRDWYEDWADLDPSNPSMLMAHGEFLRPEWYGDYDEIAREARRAVARAVEGLGGGAYMYMWRPALVSNPDALARIDTEILFAGIESTLTATMSQHLANDFAAFLYRLTRPGRGETGTQALRAEPVRARLADGVRHILRHHLREVHTPLWRMNETAIREAIADAFSAEIAKGLVIRSGDTGLEAVKP